MKLPERSKTIIPFAGLILIISIVASARGQASIVTGSVSDPLSAPIPGARITLYSLDRILQTTSDSSGHFKFENVTTGKYEFEAVAPGFKRNTKPNLSVTGLTETVMPSKPMELRVVMEIASTGSPSEIVSATEVRAPAGSCGPTDSVTYQPRKARNADALGGIVIDVYPKKPVAGATLQLFDATGAQIDRQQTNQRGEFQFKQTAPGRYYISWQHPGYWNNKSADFWVARENKTYITLRAVQQGKFVICQ